MRAGEHPRNVSGPQAQGLPQGTVSAALEAAVRGFCGDGGKNRRLARPYVPPMLGVAGGIWAGVVAAGELALAAATDGRWLGVAPVVAGAGAVAVALAAAALCAAAPGRVRVWGTALAAGCAVGLVAGWLGVSSVLGRGAAVFATPVDDCLLVVETDPRTSASGRTSFQATARMPDGRRLRAWVDGTGVSEELPSMGSLVRVRGSWADLDLGADFDRSLVRRGMGARLRARAVEVRGWQEGPLGWVRAFRARLLGALDPEQSAPRALLGGVVCGMQAACGRFGIDDDFARLGLSHLVAVSGTHLSVVAALLGRLLQRTRVPPRGRWGVLVGALGAYVAFTGLQVSALRAWVMAALAFGAPAVGRRSHAISGVGVAAGAMLVADPFCAASVGFQLSVLSVVGLAVFAPLAKEWLGALAPRKTPDWAVEGVALTLVSQACTAPVALPLFGTVPLLAPLANIAAVPLVTGLLVGGLVLAPLAALVPAWAPFVLAPCDGGAALVCAGSSWLAGVPGAAPLVEAQAWPLALALAAGAWAVYGWWPRPSAQAARSAAVLGLAVGGALVVWWGFGAPARIVVLDVGQGDAILVQDGPHAVLVDAGADDAVCTALARNRVMRLDAIVLTHTDLDHVGGLADLRGRISVERVVVARGVEEELHGDAQRGLLASIKALRGARIVEVGAGDRLRVGSFDLTVLWPCEPVAGDGNDDSLVLLAQRAVDGERFAGLLTGDAEKHVVEPLVRAGLVGRVDVLKVGHHGSAVSVSPELAEALAPVVAVASAGENNRYGHPTPACVEILEGAGALFLCTKDVGDVELRPVAGGVRVRHRGEGGLGSALGLFGSCVGGSRGVGRRYPDRHRIRRSRKEGRYGSRPRTPVARLSGRGRRRAQAPPRGRASRQAPGELGGRPYVQPRGARRGGAA